MSALIRNRINALPIVIAIAAILAIAACADDNAASAPADQAPTPAAAVQQAEDPMAFPTAVPSTLVIEPPDDVPDELKTLWEVWALLTSEHVDREEFDPEVFTEAAIRGLITALDDQHTGYVPPESFQIENDDIYGRFEGIGANVTMRRDGKLQIVAPLKGSPAEKAGLKSGDVVVAVNGEDITGLSLLEAVSKIRGPRGTEVRLMVLHLGAVDEVEISILRDVIPLESVLVRSRPEDRFAHIRLSTFYADTADQLADAIRQARSDGAEGLVLDVRNNPGGLLGAVVDVVSLFIEDGLALYQVDGSGRRTDNGVRGDAEFAELPMVLLANSFSASASEILAGALQDHDRAPVIGDTTFGKGSVNILRRLENDGGLYLTFARWFTPDGRPIEGDGLEPDYEVTSRDAQKADIDQLNKAQEVLAELVEAGRS